MTLKSRLSLPRFLTKIKFVLFFLRGAAIGLVILLLIASLVIVSFRLKYKNRVYPRVYFLSQDLSGKEIFEIEQILSREENNLFGRKVTLTWSEDGPKEWMITPEMIDLRFNREEILKEVYLKGNLPLNLGGLWESFRIFFLPKMVKPSYLYEEKKLDQIVIDIAKQVDLPAKDALFEFKEGKVVDFITSEEGRRLDQIQLKLAVITALSQYPFKESSQNLPVRKVLPKVETSQSNELGIRELLAVGESYFKDSIPSRVHNILLAASKFHGLVIAPGETFSFSEKIGTISAETGYQQAYVIKEKKTILEDGGGVCQVSTTLFRAAINAGLPIVERHPHYYRVGYYEQGDYPPGLDATVYPPSPDLKFINDTFAYLLIQTKVDKNQKRLAFEFYGTADGREIEVQKPIVYSQTPPPEPVYIDEPSLPSGVVRRLDTAHWGAKVSFKRIVNYPDGTLKEERVFWSNYVPWAAVYQRGTGQ